jgi:glycosyltransferase involved in cell wall biosynthesis
LAEDFISIVLPIYNGEKYMRESIESCLAQTHKNWELIIVDDHSTDNTALIANQYVQNDGRIRYVKNEHNLKLPKTLNKGFSLTKGDYLTWTSDDNIYKPHALASMLQALKRDKAQFVFASCEVINEAGKIVEAIHASKDYQKEIIGVNCVGACFLYARNVYTVIGDYDVGTYLAEDYDYWLRIFSQFSVIHISEYLYQYRWHSGALTSSEKKQKLSDRYELVVLKNLNGFGRLDYLSKYYLYKGLHTHRIYKTTNKERKKYELQFTYYRIWYLVFRRLPLRFQEDGFRGILKKSLNILVRRRIK